MSGIFDQIVTYSPRTVDGSGGTVLLAANNLGDVSSAENARLNLRAASETQAGLRYALPYWQCDGAATNRRFQATGINLAGSDFTLASAWFQMPTSNPSTQAFLFGATSANSSVNQGLDNSIFGHIETNGELRIRANATTGGTHYRYISFAGARAAYSGQWCRLFVAFTGNSTTAPTVWLLTQTGGLTALTGGTETTGGTPPNWADAALVSTYLLQGYNMPAGPFIPGAIINRRWAQADVEAYVLSGRFSYADAAGGATSAFYTFDGTATDSWTSDALAAFNVNTTVVGKAYMQLAASGTSRMARASGLSLGVRYRISLKLRLNSGVATTIRVGSQGSGGAGFDVTGVTSTETTFSGEFISDSATLRIGATSSNGSAYEVDDITVTKAGVLTDPTNGVQPCYVADDASPNGVPWLVVGYSPVTESKEFRIPATVDMSTGIPGNKQLLAGALFADPTKVALDTIETRTTGTPTFSVGDGTTATRYTASVAHSAGRLRETLSNNFPADSAKTGLYANVTVAGGAAEKLLIRGHIQE